MHADVARRHSCRRRRLALAAATVAATTAVAWSSPASAHPLGAPQTVRISADGHHVRVHWTAPADDLTALGLHLGVLAGARTFVYDRGVLVPEESAATDTVALGRSPQLATYLLRHVRVSQTGRTCAGTVARTDDLADDGARLEFTCPEPVARVRVHVTTLTDVHPAYRTLATSDAGQRATYTRRTPQHTWPLGANGGPSGPLTGAAVPAVAVPGVATGALALGCGIGYLLRRRSRRADGPGVAP